MIIYGSSDWLGEVIKRFGYIRRGIKIGGVLKSARVLKSVRVLIESVVID